MSDLRASKRRCATSRPQRPTFLYGKLENKQVERPVSPEIVFRSRERTAAALIAGYRELSTATLVPTAKPARRWAVNLSDPGRPVSVADKRREERREEMCGAAGWLRA